MVFDAICINQAFLYHLTILKIVIFIIITIMNTNRAIRASEQRRVIMDFLANNHTHPTALDVFNHVRTILPFVSMSTIYRNLEVLKSLGEIAKIETTVGNRYDPEKKFHVHIRCTACGKVEDINDDSLTSEIMGEIPESFDSRNVKLELLGICKDCASKMNCESLDDFAQELIMTLKRLEQPASCKQIAETVRRHSHSVNGKLKNLIQRGLVAYLPEGLYKLTEIGFNYCKEDR